MTEKVTTDDSSIDSAASELSAGLGAWLPIETAPKDRNILLWGRYWSDGQGMMRTPLFGSWNGRTGRWECAWMCWFGVRPTHWMEIPKAPNVELRGGPAASSPERPA